MKMKKILIITLLVIYAVFSIALIGFSKVEWKENWPNPVRIGAATIGGGFYMGASAFANVLNEEFSGVEIVVEQTKASLHNTRLIEANQIEFGMNVTPVAWQAWNAAGDFEEEHRNFRILTPCWPGMEAFFTLEGSGIDTLDDLEGKKVSALTRGSHTDSFVRTLFNELNIEADINNLTASDARNALENGLIDALSMGHPSPIMQELSMTKEIKLIPVSGDIIEEYQKNHPEDLYDQIIPAGYYSGVEEDTYTIGNYNILMARVDLPEDCVYSVTKALYENIDLVRSTAPQFARQLENLENIANAVTTPLHNGAIKYYEEVGVEIPKELKY